jgi:hypothetical protein
MKTETLEKADSDSEGQSSDKSKRQGAVVDLPFVLIVRVQKA